MNQWITPSDNQRPDAGDYAIKMAERPEDYRILEHMPLDENSVPVTFNGAGKPVQQIAIIDTETTGLEPDAEILELAVIRCGMDDSGNLCSIDEMLDEFNDPGVKIPVKVSELTDITDEMVRGKSIDMGKVGHILRDDPVIIAHNAKFDRPFFEKVCPHDDHEWACSVQYCDWSEKGFPGKNLGILLQLMPRRPWYKIPDRFPGKNLGILL